MNTTDLLLLAVIGVSSLLGLMRGFIGVLASLLAWVLAGWAAFRFGGQVALLLAGDGAPGPGHLLGGYGLSFLAVMLFVGLVGWTMRKAIGAIGLSGLDRVLGLAIGALRGGLVACVLVLLMGFTRMPRDGSWDGSRVVPVLLPGAQWLQGWLPGWAAGEIDFGMRAVRPAEVPGDTLVLPEPAGA